MCFILTTIPLIHPSLTYSTALYGVLLICLTALGAGDTVYKIDKDPCPVSLAFRVGMGQTKINKQMTDDR